MLVCYIVTVGISDVRWDICRTISVVIEVKFAQTEFVMCVKSRDFRCFVTWSGVSAVWVC